MQFYWIIIWDICFSVGLMKDYKTTWKIICFVKWNNWDYAVALWLHKLNMGKTENSLPKDKKGLAKNPQQCAQARENSLLQEHPTGK